MHQLRRSSRCRCRSRGRTRAFLANSPRSTRIRRIGPRTRRRRRMRGSAGHNRRARKIGRCSSSHRRLARADQRCSRCRRADDTRARLGARGRASGRSPGAVGGEARAALWPVGSQIGRRRRAIRARRAGLGRPRRLAVQAGVVEQSLHVERLSSHRDRRGHGGPGTRIAYLAAARRELVPARRGACSRSTWASGSPGTGPGR